MATSNDDPQRSTSGILVNAPTVHRGQCWRPGCRNAFPGYQTIAFLRDGRVTAFCHRRVHDDLGYRADVWKHGEAVA